MSNPAAELHELYSNWCERLAAIGAASFEAVVNPTTPEGSAEIIRAARLLARIDDCLSWLEREGHRVGVYRRQFPDWSIGMLAYPHGWRTNITAGHVMSEGHLDEIEAFASFLDGKVPVVRDGAEDHLRDLVARAHQALASDDSLDLPLRQYIHRLLQSIERALDDEGFGVTFDLGASLEQLWAAFRAAEGASKEKSSTWHDLWTQTFAGAAGNAIAQGGMLAIQALSGGM